MSRCYRCNAGLYLYDYNRACGYCGYPLTADTRSEVEILKSHVFDLMQLLDDNGVVVAHTLPHIAEWYTRHHWLE